MPDVDGETHGRRAFDHPGGGALARLAGRQRGVVSREQLGGLDFSRGQIDRLRRDGWLQLIHHNVYAVGHRHLSDRAHLLAALLTFGPKAFLSHRTAAGVWKLRAVNVHEIEVTLPGSGGRARDGLVVHRARTEPHQADVRTHGDLRVSSVPRMLIELAARETPRELERLVTLTVQKRLLRPDARDGRAALEEALARHERHPGLAKLNAALAVYRRTESRKSELERAFDRFLAQHREIPKPLRNIEIDHWEIDCFWPTHNLAVELDGRPYHVAAGAMEKDGFQVEHNQAGILRDLRHFLKLAA